MNLLSRSDAGAGGMLRMVARRSCAAARLLLRRDVAIVLGPCDLHKSSLAVSSWNNEIDSDIAWRTCRAAASSSSSPPRVAVGGLSVGVSVSCLLSDRLSRLPSRLAVGTKGLLPEAIDEPKLSALALFRSLLVVDVMAADEAWSVLLFGSSPIALSLKYVDLVVSSGTAEDDLVEMLAASEGAIESRSRRDVLEVASVAERVIGESACMVDARLDEAKDVLEA